MSSEGYIQRRLTTCYNNRDFWKSLGLAGGLIAVGSFLYLGRRYNLWGTCWDIAIRKVSISISPLEILVCGISPVLIAVGW